MTGGGNLSVMPGFCAVMGCSMNTRRWLQRAGLIAVATFAIAFAESSRAQEVVKANNSDALNLGSSWVGGSVPTASNVAVWDSTLTLPNSVVLGGDLGVAGLRIGSPGGAVTIGGGNTLTLGSSGINMSAATQDLTLNAAVTIGGTQAWNVTTGRLLDMNGSLSGSALLTKSGSGTLNLDSDNSGFSGGVSLSAGRLNIGNAKAIGSGTLTLAGTTTLGNISGGAIQIANPVSMGLANWTYAGTDRLTLGGTVSMAGSREITVSSGELVIAGGFNSGGQLSKLGTGTMTLSAANTNSQFRLMAGTLNINHANALATGQLLIGGVSTIDNTSGVAITNVNNNAMAWNANFTFAGTDDLNLGTGAVTLNAGRTVTVSAGNLTVGGGIGGAFSLTKAGSGALTLSGSNTFTNGLTLSAGTLNINHASALSAGTLTISGAATIDNTSGAAITNANNNAMAWNANFTFAGTNDLNLGTGAVTMNANRTVTVSSGSLSVGGAIGGAFSLSKGGGGTLTVGAANTYTGATFVNEGILATTASNALASSARVTVATGATLRVGASDTLAAISGSGSVVLNTGVLSVGQSTGAQLAVSLSGAGGFTKIGSNALVMAGSNTYSGPTTIQAGTLVMSGVDSLGDGGNIVFNGGALRLEPGLAIDPSSRIRTSSDLMAIATSFTTVTFASPLASSNVGGLNKVGVGTLVLTAANAYTGTTTVSGGRLLVDSGAGGSIQTSSALAFNATGTFDFDNTTASSARAQSLGALTSAAGAANVQVTRTASQNVSLAFASLGSRTASATRNFVYGGTPGTIGVDSSIAISGLSSGVIDPGTFFQGSNYAAYDAGGFVRGVEYGVDANSATSGAAASVSSVAYQRVTGNISAQQTATFTGLNLDGSANVVIGASQTITTGGLLKSGGGSSTVSGGSGIQAPTNDSLVTYASSGNTLTISTPILANGSNAFVKSGAGTVVLSSTGNTFTGGTVLNEGMLQISSADQLPAAGSIAFTGGKLQWAGATASIAATLSPRFTAAPGQTFQIDVLNSSVTLTLGTLAGSGLVKSGSGRLDLNAANTFETVTVDGGTLRGGNGATTFGAGAALYLVSGTLTGGPNAVIHSDWTHNNFYVLGNFTFINNNSGNNGGTYYQFGRMDIGTRTMTFDISGASTASGTVRIQGGVSLSGNATFNLNKAVGNEVAFVGTRESGGSFGFTKSGVGALVLEGEGFHTGVTTIADGSVRIAHADALKRSTANLLVDNSLVFGPGITAVSLGQLQGTGSVKLENLDGSPAAVALSVGGNNQSTSYSGVLSGAGSVTKHGAGALTLSGVNTFSGGLAIADGALSIGSINNAGSSGALGSGVSAVVLGSSGKRGTLSYTGATGSSSRAFSAAAGGTAAFEVTDTAATLTLSGLIGGDGDKSFGGPGSIVASGGISGGSSNVFKTGAGALTLAGASGHANTTVSEGRLNINHFAALGTSPGTLTMAGGTTLDNTSGSNVGVTNAKSIALGNSLSFLGSNSLDLGPGTVTLSGSTTIDVAANTLTFSGEVTGPGYGLIKNGAGVLELGGLSGSSSFTGNSFINAGELYLSGHSVLGGGSDTIVTVADGAFLRVGSSASLGGVTVVSRPGGVITTTVVNANQTFDQSGTLTSDNAKFNGVQTIRSGVTITAAANDLGTIPTSPTAGRIVIENGATLRATEEFHIDANQGISLSAGSGIFSVDASKALFIESAVAGGGGILKTGAGNIRLTGSNSYSGGTVIEQGIIGITSDASLGDVTGRLKLDGGTIVAAQTVSGGTVSGATINAGRQVVLANGKTSGMHAQTGLTLRYDGAIGEENGGGSAANLVFGASGAREGTVILGGANTYRGTTTVAAGTLVVNGSLGQGNLTVDAGAMLKGSGVINGFTSIQGTHSPGNSPGLETFTNGLSYGSSSVLVWELSANTALSTDRGTLYDGINLTSGTLSINPSATINLVFNAALSNGGGSSTVDWDDAFWASSQTWKVIDVQSGLWTPGVFTLGSIGADASGQAFTSSIRSGATFSMSQGNDGDIYVNYVIVPEPDTVIFAGIGIAMAGWSLWKRRRHTS